MFVRYQGNTDDKLIFNNHDSDNVSEYTHLGVIFQSNLSCNSHIDYICKKESKRLDILNGVSHKITRNKVFFVCPSGFVIRAESLVVQRTTTYLKCGCPPDFLVIRMPLLRVAPS